MEIITTSNSPPPEATEAVIFARASFSGRDTKRTSMSGCCAVKWSMRLMASCICGFETIATTIEQRVKAAYDLGSRDVLAGMLSLYPREGPVYSASGGSVTTTRDSLEAAIRQFWNYVGRNMCEPKWEWTMMRVDVLSPNSAVMTTSYRVPHLTPAGLPHVIGGAWTATFAKRDGEWVIVHEHLSDSPSP